jgi:PucR C-terminal helix-turn-helix domain
VASTSVSDASVEPAVRALVAVLESEREPLADEVVERIRVAVPGFRRLPRGTLRRAVQDTMRRELAALHDVRPPTEEELEGSRAIARERAEQGLSVEAVLHAHRLAVSVVWNRFGELARERGAGVATVLAFSETLWRWADSVMDAVAASHREVELQLAREEQQRRDAFVVALLTGSSDAAELRRDSAAHGIDPEREYLPFRARARDGDETRALSHRIALALAGDQGLVTGLDGDMIGVAARRPVPIAGLTVGIGHACTLDALPAAFTQASRALQTALAFGHEGVHSLADLSILPAVLVDQALGDAFVARYLEPLAAMGRHGAEIEATLRTWLEAGMRIEDTAKALHVHPNTLRHRLRRFEEATGASLRNATEVMELWWALERRRLVCGSRAESG